MQNNNNNTKPFNREDTITGFFKKPRSFVSPKINAEIMAKIVDKVKLGGKLVIRPNRSTEKHENSPEFFLEWLSAERIAEYKESSQATQDVDGI